MSVRLRMESLLQELGAAYPPPQSPATNGRQRPRSGRVVRTTKQKYTVLAKDGLGQIPKAGTAS